MKYAVVNGERQEAKPGLSGTCACCGNKVIAKCGELRSWHWAHCGKRMCDPWWEETEWHRAWKEQFPNEWQEVIHYAENGEKHIADIKTKQGYVIEFQHSNIKREECKARENFYRKMIWIVDGTRRLRDKKKFEDLLKDLVPIDSKYNLRKLLFDSDEWGALLRDWTNSNVPVFFDFGEEVLWSFSKTVSGSGYLFRLERNTLITSLHSEAHVNNFEVLLKGVLDIIVNEEQKLKARQQQTAKVMQVNLNRPQFLPMNRFFMRRKRRL